METNKFIPYRPQPLTSIEMKHRAESFFQLMNARRSVRHFSDQGVPRHFIEQAIRTASTAPSGAHRQPWQFVAISCLKTKQDIRIAAEKEERDFYEGDRVPAAWRDAVRPMGTNWEKPYLETAPWIVVVFEQVHSHDEQGQAQKNYYVKESVGIACGLFIAAIHNMGLVTLTHTPSPMRFLSKVLRRPGHERPFALFPIGYPAADAVVPELRRKSLVEVAVWRE